MPELFFVNEDKKINVEVGGNLRKTAIASEIGVYSNILTKLFNCRGKGICGTCVVKIDSKNIIAPIATIIIPAVTPTKLTRDFTILTALLLFSDIIFILLLF